MAKSEMNFYKIDDQNFVFSVKDSDTGKIRYYHMLMGEDCTCNVRRIRNAFLFVSQKACSRVEDFSSDYTRIITSLIDYCETDSKVVDFDARRKKAFAYSRLLRDMSSLDNLPLTNERLVASENSAFYEVDDEDREFISSGVFSTNVSNRYYIK
mgnify:CR=1 FL=1